MLKWLLYIQNAFLKLKVYLTKDYGNTETHQAFLEKHCIVHTGG